MQFLPINLPGKGFPASVGSITLLKSDCDIETWAKREGKGVRKEFPRDQTLNCAVYCISIIVLGQVIFVVEKMLVEMLGAWTLLENRELAKV